jgi:hypothetical protein
MINGLSSFTSKTAKHFHHLLQLRRVQRSSTLLDPFEACTQLLCWEPICEALQQLQEEQRREKEKGRNLG